MQIKRHKLAAIIIFVVTVCLSLGLAACDIDTGAGKCEHSYSEWTETKAATCTENGEKTRTCAICGNAETQTIDALGHDYSASWTNDESGHWHVCVREGCGVKSNEAEHTEENHCCSVCGYETSEHTYGDTTYTWNDDHSVCTATRTCTNCSAETEEHTQTANATINSTVEQNATCLLPELTTYTATFTEDWATAQIKENVQTQTALGHAYGDTSYTWNDDHSVCTATRTCTNCAAETEEHTQTIYATITSQITQAQTCKNPELTTYTATFAEDWATAQTKENVQTKTALGHVYGDTMYTWNDDHSVCTATRTCTNCSAETEGHTQTANATISNTIVQNATCLLPELTTYTATFAEDWATTQTKENVQTQTALGHDFSGNPTTDESGHYHICSHENCNEKTTDADIDKNNDYVCDICGENLLVKLKNYVADLVGDGTADSVNVTLILAKNAADALNDDELSETFVAICEGLAKAKYGSVNLTLSGVETIPVAAFVTCHALGSVTIDKDVTTINKEAFLNCENLTSVTIGNDVTIIGESAFLECRSLTEVAMGSGVKTIDKDAFNICEALSTITLGEEVTTIGNGAFGNSGLKSITFNDKIKTIGDHAFYGCTSLTSLVLPDSVKTIGKGAFSYCWALETVVFGSGVETIADGVFSECIKLETITLNDGLKSIGEQAFYKCRSLKSAKIPDSVTSIGDDVFMNCSNITEITLGKKVTELPNKAFYATTALTSLVFRAPITKVNTSSFNGVTPENVTLTLASGQKVLSRENDNDSWTATDESFDGNVFCECTFKEIIIKDTKIDATSMSYNEFLTKIKGLIAAGETDITVKLSKGNLNVDASVIANCILGADFGSVSLTIEGDIEQIFYNDFDSCSALKSITIPASVTIIYDYAFYGCNALETVTFADGSQLKTLGDVAFYGCTALESITIPASVTSIGNNAFQACTALTSVTFEQNSNLESIGGNAFYQCSSLTSITIPASVTSIGDYAFYTCTALTSVTFEQNSQLESIGTEAFYGCEALETVKFENGSKLTTIGNAFEQCYALKSITIPASVTSIGDNAFAGRLQLTSVVFEAGSKLESIGTKAFNCCEALTSITIPASVTSIGKEAFEQCFALETVTFEDGCQLGVIGERAFMNCKVTSITIPANVTSIGKEAFNGCELKTVTFENGSKLTTIGNAFDGCTALESITIPASVTSIGEKAFYKFLALASVTFEENSNLATIGESAFEGCTALKSITVPASVTSIGDNAFGSCTSLKTVTFTDGCTVIGTQMFQGCTALTSVTIPTSVTSIGNFAFGSCKALTSITIPEGVTSLGESAFQECTALETVSLPGSLTAISSQAFVVCTALTSITIPEGVTSIGESAFQGCTALKTVYLPKSLTTISDKTFGDCESLTFKYSGTLEEFKNISKSDSWIYTAATVKCTDGETTCKPN